MHLQIFHTNHFYIKSLKESNRPIDIKSFNSREKRKRYYNCLVVFSTIEIGDNEKTCENAKLEILKIYKELNSADKCSSIVIVPYSHQSNVETDSEKSLSLLRMLFKLLRNYFENATVYFGDFGFSNEWEINVKSHRLSCLYRKI